MSSILPAPLQTHRFSPLLDVEIDRAQIPGSRISQSAKTAFMSRKYLMGYILLYLRNPSERTFHLDFHVTDWLNRVHCQLWQSN